MSRRPDVTSEVVDGQAILVPPSGQEIITLNAVGTLIWDALDHPRDLDELLEYLLERVSGVERDELTRDVEAFLRELQASELIEGFR